MVSDLWLTEMKQARHRLDDEEVQQTAFECLITAQFNRKKGQFKTELQ